MGNFLDSYCVEEIIDERQCEICKDIDENYFLRSSPVRAENQKKVNDYLAKRNLNVCCDYCFYNIVEGLI